VSFLGKLIPLDPPGKIRQYTGLGTNLPLLKPTNGQFTRLCKAAETVTRIPFSKGRCELVGSLETMSFTHKNELTWMNMLYRGRLNGNGNSRGTRGTTRFPFGGVQTFTNSALF
jgi:hypothetical protein